MTQSTQTITSVRCQGDACIAALRGEIDLHISPDLRERLMDILDRDQPKNLVLNLSEVTYMDSSAIAVLVESLKRLRSSGGRVTLTGLQPRVRGLLEIAKLETIFNVVETEDEALAK